MSRTISPTRTRALAAAVFIPALVLAACGQNDSDEPSADTDEDAAADDDGDAPDEDLPPEVAEAAKNAEDLGMQFITSRDELVRLANENGPILAYISSDFPEAAAEAFTAEYPDISAQAEDFSGTDAYQRYLLEAESGTLSDLDIQQAPPEHYDEFHSYFAPYDILGMAEAGILDIPIEMIDPERRNVVFVGSQIAGYAYNPDLVDGSTIPQEWEGFCDTSFLNGESFIFDLRPSNVAPLVAEWGQERVNEMVECLMETDPILTRGTTEALTRVTAGEVAMHIFTNYHSAIRSSEEAGGALEVELIEPVPVRLSNALGVLNEDVANNPYAALLFIELMAGPTGQEILDRDPLKSSIYAEGSDVQQAIGDRETSVANFEHYDQMSSYMEEIVDLLPVGGQ